MAIDEFFLHRRRGLGWWERIGHPLDTLSVLGCLVLASFFPMSRENIFIFASCALISCVLVTKDEWVHSRECSGFENWLHAFLFMVHPLILGSALVFWTFRVELLVTNPDGAFVMAERLTFADAPSSLTAQLSLYGLTGLTALFFIYQLRSVAKPYGRVKKKDLGSKAIVPSSSGLTTETDAVSRQKVESSEAMPDEKPEFDPASARSNSETESSDWGRGQA